MCFANRKFELTISYIVTMDIMSHDYVIIINFV